ncbi:MAG: TolC family protein [Bacteroidales bacterium]|nr:TolC family protein [Bacteroidales bacterium]
MNHFKLSILTLGLFVPFLAVAQKTWSLADCINYAHANNLQLKRAELQSQINTNNYFQSQMNILPGVNAGFERSYYFGRHIDVGTNQIIEDNSHSDYLGVQASVNLFTGLGSYNTIKMNKYSMLAGIQDVEKEKVDITLQIALGYLEILFQKELLQVTRNQLNTMQMQVERTQKLVEAGSVARGNLYEIQAQLANEKLNTVNAGNALKVATINLVQLLDLDSVAGFEVDPIDSLNISDYPLLLSETEIYNEALLFLPHLKSAEYKLKAYEQNLKVQKGRYSPTVYANTSLGTRYSSSQENQFGQNYSRQMDVNFNKTFGLGVNIPIFNKWQVNNAVSNARVSMYDAGYNLEQTKQQLYKEIRQAYYDAVSSGEKHKAAAEAVNSYKEAFVYTEQKYNVGMVNSVEYNIAKNNYIKAESELLQAKFQYIFSIKILDFYRGKPLVL